MDDGSLKSKKKVAHLYIMCSAVLDSNSQNRHLSVLIFHNVFAIDLVVVSVFGVVVGYRPRN